VEDEEDEVPANNRDAEEARDWLNSLPRGPYQGRVSARRSTNPYVFGGGRRARRFWGGEPASTKEVAILVIVVDAICLASDALLIPPTC
jgi:hypothetical protein